MKCRNKLQQQKVAVKGKTTKNERRNMLVIPQKGKGQKRAKTKFDNRGSKSHTPTPLIKNRGTIKGSTTFKNRQKQNTEVDEGSKENEWQLCG